MSQPWFDPEAYVQYAWIPGTLLGGIGALLGTLSSWLVPRGKARGLMMGLCIVPLIVCTVLLAIGIWAFVDGQPWAIWYCPVLMGVIGVPVLGGALVTIRKGYRDAEQRRVAAQDLFV